jgi:hypothetical protein
LTRVHFRDIRLGLKVAIADINVDALETFAKELCATYGEGNVLALPTDVSKLEDVERLRDRVYEAWGEVRVVRRARLLPNPSSLPCPREKREGEGGRASHRGAFPCPHPLFCF